jgi:hypothetical protein
VPAEPEHRLIGPVQRIGGAIHATVIRHGEHVEDPPPTPPSGLPARPRSGPSPGGSDALLRRPVSVPTAFKSPFMLTLNAVRKRVRWRRDRRACADRVDRTERPERRRSRNRRAGQTRKTFAAGYDVKPRRLRCQPACALTL